MNTRLNNLKWLFVTIALVALTLFTGCRAFQPEAVVVNRAPETFLIGAPLAEGGGYYHYHMFWYGQDEDGVVERFVWAVTDTSVQNEDTADDEEDARFNPALDITHLEFSHWTTKTDSIFDFQINHGAAPSADMTFHMVAVDDFGDFDRTPARLHFFSNTLGTPVINFFRVEDTGMVALAHGVPDTVGFGKRYELYWEGSTPNILGYDETALTVVDTVPPRNDGLYGYKWQLGGALGGNCVPTFEDCWHPRLFNEATSDSFSYFAEINSLTFLNDASSSTNPFGMELPSGAVNVSINSVDVAGVEVASHLRNFSFVVNHDPLTRLVVGTDPYHPEDTTVYPYYTLLNDDSGTQYPFSEGDRIPDRSYVVFKALAKDHPDDKIVEGDPAQYPDGFKIGMTGVVNGTRENYTGGPFSFTSGASEIDYEPDWDIGLDGWYADTLGFLVGPRTEFSFSMQAIDIHGRRDGTPPSFNFFVGYPPCVQCIELQDGRVDGSGYTEELDCHDPNGAAHECFDEETTYYVLQDDQLPMAGRTYLEHQYDNKYLAINKATMTPSIRGEEPDDGLYYSFECLAYSMTVFLHGKDDPREAWLDARNRSRGWKYQVDYDCDPGNLIQDGEGFDDLLTPTWGYEYGTENIELSDVDGLWKLTVNFYVPIGAVERGWDFFRFLTNLQIGDEEITDQLMEICLRQMSGGSVRALVLDQTDCNYPSRPAKYHLFETVRPPRALVGSETWRDCFPSYASSTILLLKDGTMDSATYNEDGVMTPSEQFFNIVFQNGFEDTDDVQCGWTSTRQ